MMFKLRICYLLLLMLLIIVGCKQKEEAPVKPEAPKPAVQKPTMPKGEIRSIASDFQKVNLVEVRGKTITAGMFADELFAKKIFGNKERIGKEESKDPRNPNISLVTYHFKTSDRYINIVMAGTGDAGKYRVREILVKKVAVKK